MKTFGSFVLLFWSILVISCSKDQMLNPPQDDISLKSALPHMRIAVMSDLHYLDPSLMVNCTNSGTVFTNELKTSNKLIQFSDPILQATVSKIVAENPDILLIPGDLTKDGEKVSHETVAEILKQLSNQGIKVFVVPGNHDILNPDAKAYSGTGSEPTENITAADFAEIYSEFGYENAFSRDCNSLSYITQPFNNLWILGIDANKYYENTPAGPARSGKIKPETMEWMLKWLAEAKKNNITVLALMHHGMMEVCTGQETFYKGYVIDDREACADALTDAGLRAIFTGHFHSNDITMRKKGENTLFDIKTGSLLTPPSPYRIINMDPNYMNINTYHITSIDAAIPGGADFVSYSTEYLFKNMTRLMTGLFMSPSYNMPQETAVTLAPHFAKGLGVLYASDGQLSAEEEVFVNGLPTQLKTVIISFYTDLPPNDLQYVVDMRKKLR